MLIALFLTHRGGRNAAAAAQQHTKKNEPKFSEQVQYQFSAQEEIQAEKDIY